MTQNRLGSETSPYLLQHKDNPVHWWPWGPAALVEARRTGKPILLSVGYAACHWCHVMAHESFENSDTAAMMNELFVNIKVDREERPDIDAIYMGALHRLGEHGGWPLTMFLDSDARPFWGGTYFPPTPRYGKPSFSHVLKEVARIYREEPQNVEHNASMIISSLSERRTGDAIPVLSDAFLADFIGRLTGATDPVHGGLKGAPKFPQWSIFQLLWRGGIRYDDDDALTAVERTLVHICQGGIYDHIGGGFARYSVDERWLVPHFEKMLYDNALLIDLMTEVWRETSNPLFEKRISETVAWLEREMIAAGDGFAASLDADSEGEEGKFYVWSPAEVMDVLGPEAGRRFCSIYDITEGGNFEGHSIPNRLLGLELLAGEEESELERQRELLLKRRAGRIRPGWDDKVLADWNGLMIAALARAAITFDRTQWLSLAEKAFAFVETHMQPEGRLRHSWRLGRLTGPGTASDYANMCHAALRLYQATTNQAYLDSAVAWAETLQRHHWLPEGGGYATTADDTDDVIVRMVSATDDAVPNANAVMLSNLVTLFSLTGDDRWLSRARTLQATFGADLGRNLVAHCGFIGGLMDLESPTLIAVIGGNRRDQLSSVVRGVSLPGATELWLPAGVEGRAGTPLAGKRGSDGQTTLYACVGPTCSLPVTDQGTAKELLDSARRAPSKR
jgi:uncharacterized protein YyaL (SSP411 family)